jgi:hypothetical protein
MGFIILITWKRGLNMNGQLSTLNNYLEKYDPTKIISEMIGMQMDYNKDKTYFGRKIELFEYIRLKIIEKYRYIKFKRKVNKMTHKMAEMLCDHPDYLLLLSQRSMTFFLQYCFAYELDRDKYLASIFGDGVSVNIKSFVTDDGINNIQAYTIIVRAPMPVDLEDSSKDRFAITTLDAQLEDRTYTLDQVCYDCPTKDMLSMAKVLYHNRFEVGSDGRMVNPNYAISKELFETDMDNYRLIIGQLLVFLAGIIDASSNLMFLERNN